MRDAMILLFEEDSARLIDTEITPSSTTGSECTPVCSLDLPNNGLSAGFPIRRAVVSRQRCPWKGTHLTLEHLGSRCRLVINKEDEENGNIVVIMKL